MPEPSLTLAAIDRPAPEKAVGAVIRSILSCRIPVGVQLADELRPDVVLINLRMLDLAGRASTRNPRASSLAARDCTYRGGARAGGRRLC